MARKANLKKGVKGPMKMKSGSFLEPNKELKFGGVKKYVKGGDPSESNQDLLSYLSAWEKLTISDPTEKIRLATERKNKAENNRGESSGNNTNAPKANTTSGRPNVGRPLTQSGNSSEPRRSDTGEGYTRGSIGTPKATMNGRPGSRATTGKGKDVKTLISALENVPGKKKSTSNPSSSRPSQSTTPKPTSSRSAATKPTPSRQAPARATAISRGNQATSVPSSKPTAELQPSRRTVPSASSGKTMSKGKNFSKDKPAAAKSFSKGKDYSKDSSKETNKMTDRRASSTSSKEKRQDSKSSRRENIKSAKANLRAARRG